MVKWTDSLTLLQFAAVDQISSGLLTSPVSGLLGLAWQTLALSEATRFRQTLASSGARTDPGPDVFPAHSVRICKCVMHRG